MATLTLVKTLTRSTPTAIDKLANFVFGDMSVEKYNPDNQYAVGDYMYMIDESGKITFYQCIEATSGEFDPDKWKIVTVIGSIGSGAVISEVEPADPNISTWYKPIKYGYHDLDTIIPEMDFEKLVFNIADGNVIITGVLPPKRASDPHFYGNISLPTSIHGYPVTTIGENAFINAVGLTNLIIPNNVTSIGIGAFSISDNTVSYPDELRYIKTIKFGFGISNITRNSFANQKEIVSLDFPATVDEISNLAFNNCTGLVSVTIRNRHTIIGADAFLGCESLRYVYGYPGSTSEDFALESSLTFVALT